MIGHQVPVLELQAGQEVHLEPHRVHGGLITPVVADVEVERTAWADETHRDVLLFWRSCSRFLGAQPGYCGCTLYSSVQCVLVIGTNNPPLSTPTVIMRNSAVDGPKLDPLPADGAAAGTRFTITCADGERIEFPDSTAGRALIAVIEAGCDAADAAHAEWAFAQPPGTGEMAA